MNVVRRFLSLSRPSLRACRTAGGTVATLLLAAACTPGAAGRGVKGPLTEAERQARVERMLSWEGATFTKHPVAFLDGLAAGEVESMSAPRIECASGECNMHVELGKDSEGDAHSIDCVATTTFQAFGPQLKRSLDGATLSEVPRIETKEHGEGIAVAFAANVTHEDEESVQIGTSKLAVLYAHGYMTTCEDTMAGGRKTFDRIVGQLFTSLKFKADPSAPTMFSSGYQERAGDRTTGFRYQYIAKRTGDAPGFSEFSAAFSLSTDGKTWQVLDHGEAVERDEKGEIESMRSLIWLDGKGPVVLSAKPTEDKRFRLKIEAGDKSDALEAMPKAPLATEFWSAPELVRVSSGAASSYRYAILSIDASDPTFRYITLTRSAAGVLLEDEEVFSSTGKKVATKATEPKVKDELHVDARGLVTKEVSSNSVSELIHTWGELPMLLRPGNGKVKGDAKPGPRDGRPGVKGSR